MTDNKIDPKIKWARQMTEEIVEYGIDNGEIKKLRGKLIEYDKKEGKTITVLVDGEEVVYDVHGIPVKKQDQKKS